MSARSAAEQSGAGIAREMHRAMLAIVVGAVALIVLVVAAHRVIAWTDEQGAYNRRVAALAYRLHLVLRSRQLPEGVAPDAPLPALRDPEAFASQAERAFGEAVETAEEIASLHARHDAGRRSPSMARLARALESFRRLRARYEGDRAGFARALYTTPTFLEIVALQSRRRHEINAEALIERRERLVAVLEVAGIAVVIAVVLGARRFVRGSFRGIDAILAEDARTRRQLAESLAQREAALREKEVLLKEVYHRVKNNLQVVSSLLNMQSLQVRDPQALHMFEESANRVRSMALVHEQLYRSQDLGRISCREFVEELTARLAESYSGASRAVRVVTDVDGLELDLVTAVPCALILNELITNAFLHAFPTDEAGTIRISMRRLEGGRARLAVEDDGVGLPEGFDPAHSRSLGMRIVRTLARQIDGDLEYRSEGGAHFVVAFPENG